MSDVRLTATNPEDSSVVPVACNSKGELLVEDVVIDSIDGDLTVQGFIRGDAPGSPWKSTGSFYGVSTHDDEKLGEIYHHGALRLSIVAGGYRNSSSTWTSYNSGANWGGSMIQLSPTDGGITFHVDETKADGSDYTIPVRFEVDESGGHAPNFYLHRDGIEREGGEVIDVGKELEFLRTQVKAMMEKLRMSPEGGWPVWDGSDDA